MIVTARYVMAFALAGTLTMLATLPRARRVLPLFFFFGLAVPVFLEELQPQTLLGLVLVTSILGGMLAGVLTSTNRRVVWIVAIGVALTVTRIILNPVFPDLLRIGAAGLTVLLWRASLSAVRNHKTVRFADRAFTSVGLLLSIVLLFRLGIRMAQDADATRLARPDRWGNVQWRITQELQSHGISPGTRVAIIGPHADSYWVRTGRMHIVANVPRPLTSVLAAVAAGATHCSPGSPAPRDCGDRVDRSDGRIAG